MTAITPYDDDIAPYPETSETESQLSPQQLLRPTQVEPKLETEALADKMVLQPSCVHPEMVNLARGQGGQHKKTDVFHVVVLWCQCKGNNLQNTQQWYQYKLAGIVPCFLIGYKNDGFIEPLQTLP